MAKQPVQAAIMIAPIRWHVKGLRQLHEVGCELPAEHKAELSTRHRSVRKRVHCGRKVHKEQSLVANGEIVAWQLIKQMVVGGESKPAEPAEDSGAVQNGLPAIWFPHRNFLKLFSVASPLFRSSSNCARTGRAARQKMIVAGRRVSS
jgi:hypothetical protein